MNSLKLLLDFICDRLENWFHWFAERILACGRPSTTNQTVLTLIVVFPLHGTTIRRRPSKFKPNNYANQKISMEKERHRERTKENFDFAFDCVFVRFWLFRVIFILMQKKKKSTRKMKKIWAWRRNRCKMQIYTRKQFACASVRCL